MDMCQAFLKKDPPSFTGLEPIWKNNLGENLHYGVSICYNGGGKEGGGKDEEPIF